MDYTFSSGERPYGLNVILVGYDSSVHERPKIFCMNASGNIFQCRAAAVGKNSEKALKELEDRGASEEITLDDETAVSLLKSVMASCSDREELDDGANVAGSSISIQSTPERGNNLNRPLPTERTNQESPAETRGGV